MLGFLKELFDNRTFKKMKILTCKVELRRWHVGEKRKKLIINHLEATVPMPLMKNKK